MQPSQIVLTENRAELTISWPDGTANVIDAVTLRRASRAASEIRRQVEGRDLLLPPGLHVSSVEPIGNYALRLVFSDGHDRGIYPFAYLRELARQRVA